MSAWHAMVGALPFDWAQYEFMRLALLAVLLVGPALGAIGTSVVNHQMAFFTEAVGHAALTGIAIGALAGMGDPFWAMILFAVALAGAVTALRRWSPVPPDTVVGLCMAFAVALGVVLLSRGGGFGRYTSFLVGDLLTLSPAELGRLAVILLAGLAVWSALYNRLLLISTHRSLAHSRGVHTWTLEAAFAGLVAVVVTASLPWVGLLVINSLLILPAAAARNVARSAGSAVVAAAGIGLCSGIGGLLVSYHANTATGATIVLFAMGFYLVTLPFRAR
jgi:zinc transport system permease protein